MPWEYMDTNCRGANICEYSPRCTAKSKKDAECWEPKEKLYERMTFKEFFKIYESLGESLEDDR